MHFQCGGSRVAILSAGAQTGNRGRTNQNIDTAKTQDGTENA